MTVKRILLIVILPTIVACTGHMPMKTVDSVDLERFMGNWYVIANIPTFIEKNAVNAVENYELNEDGTIATTFSFRKGSSEGQLKQYYPKGFVIPNTGNAQWGMQFLWPIKADYRIAYLSDDYSETIIGREARDYVWLMARKPTMDDARYESLLKVISQLGYDLKKINKVKQQWEDELGKQL